MEGFAIDDKYISFLNKRGFVMDNMRCVPIQHNHELGEVEMLMQVKVLVMSAILNEERKLLILREPFQIDVIQYAPPFFRY